MNESRVDWKAEFRERMLRSAQQFAREMAAAEAGDGVTETITVEDLGDGVTVHFWAQSKADANKAPAESFNAVTNGQWLSDENASDEGNG